MKLRSGVWFAVAVVALLGAWFGGNYFYTLWFIVPQKHALLEPGRLNLIGTAANGIHF